MSRKRRVETYLDPETIAQIDDQQMGRSEFIREAVRDRLATAEADA